MSGQARNIAASMTAYADPVPSGDADATLVPFAGYLAMSARDPAQPAHWRHSVLEAGCEKVAHGERGTVALVPGGAAGRTGEVAPGLSMTVQVVRPGEVTSAHRHAFWHLYVVAQGQGRAHVACDLSRSSRAGSSTLRQSDYVVARGDVFYVPPWASHWLDNPHADDALVLYVVQNLPQLAGLGTLLREAPDGSLDHVFRRTSASVEGTGSAGE
ncbi:hypothetical protein CY652_13710 [Burkholderia sp. WAC0059]|uniref:cupin domain-containing protein n=1 Tax=Burkholderia sp. WAC0059 TaxID=2066022 RepID=UPI000C7EDBAA|nr:cupin domain-containing protein [Burkholderia sp. WAC0059]PLZ01739.1 hypothetical protein CY652_13710 [Burkholderia sp. WAC0059]